MNKFFFGAIFLLTFNAYADFNGTWRGPISMVDGIHNVFRKCFMNVTISNTKDKATISNQFIECDPAYIGYRTTDRDYRIEDEKLISEENYGEFTGFIKQNVIYTKRTWNDKPEERSISMFELKGGKIYFTNNHYGSISSAVLSIQPLN